jgi:hypothetical protein
MPIDPKAVEAARRIVEWADAGKLADDEWLVENNETAIINICRALLTASQARDEVVEECAKIVEAQSFTGSRGSIRFTCRIADTAKAIRSLKTGERDAG